MNIFTALTITIFLIGYFVGRERGRRDRTGDVYQCEACKAIAHLELSSVDKPTLKKANVKMSDL